MTLIELDTERMAAGGDAVAREDSGRVVFVRGALPGERVRAEVTEEKRDFAKARVVDVLTAAEARRPPPCPYVPRGCGGCGWQHIEDEAQVDLKLGMVRESLQRIGGIAHPRISAGPPLAPFGYRTTVRLGVDGDGQAGFRAWHRHELVAVEHCLVTHPLLDELLTGRFPGATEVTLRCGVHTGERVALVEPVEAGLRAELPLDVLVGPKARFHELVAGHRFRVSARSFFQTRLDGAEALVAAVRDAVAGADGDVVVDAFSGVGLFAATVLPGAEVVAIERTAAAYHDARRNLADRKATFVHADVARWRARPADVVIADPARAGLGRAGVNALGRALAPRFVLVSCDPVSLARDAKLLDELGYRHERSVVIDLFPQTPHAEVVTRFDLR